jgi:DNA-binding GntR family transcriptional regulator
MATPIRAALHTAEQEDAMTTADSTPDPHEIVRDAILNGELPPGQVYSQSDLSDLLGVGRTPLREAVRRLQSEGLLDVSPRRRLRIAPLTLEDLSQLYSMRIMLETLAVRLTVPHLTATDLAEARRALDEHIDACDRQDLDLAREPHRRFHHLLYSRSGDRLLGQVTNLWDQAQRYRRLYVTGASDEIALLHLAAADHEAIFDAASKGDAARCAELVARHLSRTALTIFAQLDDEEGASVIRIAQDIARNGANVT